MQNDVSYRVSTLADAFTRTQQCRWRHRPLATLLLLLLLPAICQGTDDAIRDALIKHSIATYPGNCPCPYNLDSAGRRCGKRSAYSRPGGETPLCYREDVTPQMIERFKSDQR